ncbi:DUF3560 domain-containing protein [Nonomuraea endophytica]|uniref:Putative RNA methylase n=1 Tax=Nonomuraea endophytica TaxID=714136 RepID=A0A7W8A830_9ACTN|nr:DUF3560 domain-containing protein [Nonomuraea endophytica]MBB5081285.1 putative RNA methylase [Nonomuraea endophytica]
MITIRHTHVDGTLVEGTRKGDGAWEILKPIGFHYFPSIRAIGIRHSRDRVADRWKINRGAEKLREAGFEVAVEIDDEHRDRATVLADQADRLEDRRHALENKAERHAGRAASAYGRAHEIADGIPMGQPILIGHHSERRARKDREKIDRAMQTGAQESDLAHETARRANAVGSAAAHSARPRVTARRIKKAETELRGIQRSLDGYERVFRDYKGDPYYIETHQPVTGQQREQLLARKAQLEDQLAYDKQQVAAAVEEGVLVEYGKHNVHVGDRVWAWGYNGLAMRVNTVTVRLDFRDHWQPKVPFTDVLKVECPHADDGPVVAATSSRPVAKREKVAVAPIVDQEAMAALKSKVAAVNTTASAHLDVFVTPPELAVRLAAQAGVRAGVTVLEPSAGTGNIARAAAACGGLVDCVEFHPGMAGQLADAGLARAVLAADFLTVDPGLEELRPDGYDAVIMNPPFRSGKDIAHVNHALRFVKPGGTLVAVMSAGVAHGTRTAAVAFRGMVEARAGRIEQLPAETFKASGTLVRALLVVIPG